MPVFYWVLCLDIWSSINWLGFLVLDIGIQTVEAIPLDTRVAVGFLQTISVRCAGFAAVSVASLAPAVLYVLKLFGNNRT